MAKELKQWLQEERKLSKKTLKMLVKEDLVTAEVMSALTDDDLQKLVSKHSLTMGETVQLRSARDAVLRGEFPPPSGRSEPAEVDSRTGSDFLREEEARAPASEAVHCSTGDSTVPDTAPEAEVSHIQEPSQSEDETDQVAKHGELEGRLKEADQLHKQGNTEEANKKVAEVMVGAQEIAKDMSRPNIPGIAGNIEGIDSVTGAFRSRSNQQKYFLCCCTLL